MDTRNIRNTLQHSDRMEFGGTPLHARTCALAEARAGKPLLRTVIPTIRLDNPKTTAN